MPGVYTLRPKRVQTPPERARPRARPCALFDAHRGSPTPPGPQDSTPMALRRAPGVDRSGWFLAARGAACGMPDRPRGGSPSRRPDRAPRREGLGGEPRSRRRARTLGKPDALGGTPERGRSIAVEIACAWATSEGSTPGEAFPSPRGVEASPCTGSPAIDSRRTPERLADAPCLRLRDFDRHGIRREFLDARRVPRHRSRPLRSVGDLASLQSLHKPAQRV